MAKLNDFIVENQEALHQFFDSISTADTSVTTVEVSNDVPDTVAENGLLYLHAYIYDNVKKLVADLTDIGDNQTATQLQNVINELGEPARIKK